MYKPKSKILKGHLFGDGGLEEDITIPPILLGQDSNTARADIKAMSPTDWQRAWINNELQWMVNPKYWGNTKTKDTLEDVDIVGYADGKTGIARYKDGQYGYVGLPDDYTQGSLPELIVYGNARPATPEGYTEEMGAWVPEDLSRGEKDLFLEDLGIPHDEIVRQRAEEYLNQWHPASGAVLEVYPEFDAFTLGRGLITNGMWDLLKEGTKTAYKEVVPEAIKPGGSFWTNPLTRGMAYGTLMSNGVDLATNLFTGYDNFGQGLLGTTNQGLGLLNNYTGYDWRIPDNFWTETAASMFNPGWWMNPEQGINALSKATTAVGRTGQRAYNIVDLLYNRATGNLPGYYRNIEGGTTENIEDELVKEVRAYFEEVEDALEKLSVYSPWGISPKNFKPSPYGEQEMVDLSKPGGLLKQKEYAKRFVEEIMIPRAQQLGIWNQEFVDRWNIMHPDIQVKPLSSGTWGFFGTNGIKLDADEVPIATLLHELRHSFDANSSGIILRNPILRLIAAKRLKGLNNKAIELTPQQEKVIRDAYLLNGPSFKDRLQSFLGRSSFYGDTEEMIATNTEALAALYDLFVKEGGMRAAPETFYEWIDGMDEMELVRRIEAGVKNGYWQDYKHFNTFALLPKEAVKDYKLVPSFRLQYLKNVIEWAKRLKKALKVPGLIPLIPAANAIENASDSTNNEKALGGTITNNSDSTILADNNNYILDFKGRQYGLPTVRYADGGHLFGDGDTVRTTPQNYTGYTVNPMYWGNMKTTEGQPITNILEYLGNNLARVQYDNGTTGIVEYPLNFVLGIAPEVTVYGQRKIPTPEGFEEILGTWIPKDLNWQEKEMLLQQGHSPEEVAEARGQQYLGQLHPASGGLKEVYPEFDILTAGRGLIQNKVLDPIGNAVYNWGANKLGLSTTGLALKMTMNSPWGKGLMGTMFGTMGADALMNGDHQFSNTLNYITNNDWNRAIPNIGFNLMDASMVLPIAAATEGTVKAANGLFKNIVKPAKEVFNAYKEVLPRFVNTVKDFTGASKNSRTLKAGLTLLNPSYTKVLAKSPEIMDVMKLWEYPEFSVKDLTDFQKVWAEEAAKGPYVLDGGLQFATLEGQRELLPELFESGRKVKHATDVASRYGRLLGLKYLSSIDKLTDPVLRHIAEVSPLYLPELVEQLELYGGATESFVKDLIRRSNSYRRFMREPHTSEEFGTFNGSGILYTGDALINVEGQLRSDWNGEYGNFPGYFEGQPNLQGDISTWWDQRIPEGVTAKRGIHTKLSPEVAKAYEKFHEMLLKGEGFLSVDKAFKNAYRDTGASPLYYEWPTHQIFLGEKGTLLPNFKITTTSPIESAPKGFTFGKGYSYGGPLVQQANVFGDGGDGRTHLPRVGDSWRNTETDESGTVVGYAPDVPYMGEDSKLYPTTSPVVKYDSGETLFGVIPQYTLPEVEVSGRLSTPADDLDTVIADMATAGIASTEKMASDQLKEGINNGNWRDIVNGAATAFSPLAIPAGPLRPFATTLFGIDRLLVDPNGIQKTGRELLNGNYWNAAKSFAGDVFNGAVAGAGMYGMADDALNLAARIGSTNAKSIQFARALNGDIRDTTLGVNPRTIAANYDIDPVSRNIDADYTLFDAFGDKMGQGWMAGVDDGTRYVNGIKSTNIGRGVTEDIYNTAVGDTTSGLRSGVTTLYSPEKTLAVTRGKMRYVPEGYNEEGLPVTRIIGPSSKPLPQRVSGSHYMEIQPETEIRYNEITGQFEEVPVQRQQQDWAPTSFAFYERPSKLSPAERFGLPKHDRNMLTDNELTALEDLELYKNRGQYKQRFTILPGGEDFGWTTSTTPGQPFEIWAAKEGIPAKGGIFRIGVTSNTGKGTLSYNMGRNTTLYSSSMFPSPEGFKWAPGEANVFPRKGGYLIILTAPKTDAQLLYWDGKPIIESIQEELPNTIDKAIMKDFWINARKILKPGTYLSGDIGAQPKGAELIDAFKRKQLYKTDIRERPLESLLVTRTGMSPDAYSSVIRQGNRDGSLRWGEGFAKWNNSAVLNRGMYEAWQLYMKDLITALEYENIYNKWMESLGANKPLQWRKIGNREYPIHPHPYIYLKDLGGSLNILKV